MYPHEMLEGMELPGGWKVKEKLRAGPEATGGQFSCGYMVEDMNGNRGYLKALDFFSPAKHVADPSKVMAPLMTAFNFERELLARCKHRKLRRIVTALADGAVTVPNVPDPARVQYIIFELAEGDVRAKIGAADSLDLAWTLRSLHHVAVGLNQIHSIRVAHQDLKPSNVLVFDQSRSSKLGDLGRAVTEDGVSPEYSDFDIAGDRAYAPPELLYRAPSDDWGARRIGCDLYHLGSLISSMFTTAGMTPLILARLTPSVWAERWKGSYSDVLPYVQAAFSEALSYIENEIPMPYRNPLIRIAKQLCDPDPKKRGHPKDKTNLGNRYSVYRYVAELNVLATRAEYEMSRNDN